MMVLLCYYNVFDIKGVKKIEEFHNFILFFYFSYNSNAVFCKMIIFMVYWWFIIGKGTKRDPYSEILDIWKVYRFFTFHPIFMLVLYLFGKRLMFRGYYKIIFVEKRKIGAQILHIWKICTIYIFHFILAYLIRFFFFLWIIFFISLSIM